MTQVDSPLRVRPFINTLNSLTMHEVCIDIGSAGVLGVAFVFHVFGNIAFTTPRYWAPLYLFFLIRLGAETQHLFAKDTLVTTQQQQQQRSSTSPRAAIKRGHADRTTKLSSTALLRMCRPVKPSRGTPTSGSSSSSRASGQITLATDSSLYIAVAFFTALAFYFAVLCMGFQYQWQLYIFSLIPLITTCMFNSTAAPIGALESPRVVVRRIAMYVMLRNAETVMLLGALPMLMASSDGITLGSFAMQVTHLALMFLVRMSLGFATFSILYGKDLECMLSTPSTATTGTASRLNHTSNDTNNNASNLRRHKSDSEPSSPTTMANTNNVGVDDEDMLANLKRRSGIQSFKQAHRMFDLTLCLLIGLFGILWEPGPMPVTLLACLLSNLVVPSSPLDPTLITLEGVREIVSSAIESNSSSVLLNIKSPWLLVTRSGDSADGMWGSVVSDEDKKWLEQGEQFWTKRNADGGSSNVRKKGGSSRE